MICNDLNNLLTKIFLQMHLNENDCSLIYELKNLKTSTYTNEISTIISMMSIASNSSFNRSKIKNIVNFNVQTKIKSNKIANKFNSNSTSMKSCFEFDINDDMTFEMLLL